MLFNFFERSKKLDEIKGIEEPEEYLNMEEIEKVGINQEEIELAKKLDAVQEFSIDRFEENIAVLENRETGEIVNIGIEKLPEEIKEGDILKCINGKYILDKDKNIEEKENIKKQMDSLWE